MAFDRADTDVLYERRIRPVLEGNGIVPVIIDRRQSNDDLNKQIMEQLDARSRKGLAVLLRAGTLLPPSLACVSRHYR
jgi:hypothetical protein